MDIERILITPTESHPPQSSAGNSASSPQPIAKTTSASTPSINIHKTTAMIEAPVPDLDAIAEGALPHEGLDDMYDDSRHNSPEVNPGPDKRLPNLPPYKENPGRSKPQTIEPSPRIPFPANSQLIDTSPAAPASGVNVHGTTAATSSGARDPILPWLGRKAPLASRPIDTTTAAPSSGINVYGTTSTNSCDGPRNLAPSPGTTSPIISRRPNTAGRYSNRIPDIADIINVDASLTRPNAAARSSNRIPDVAEIIDVDASVTRPNAAARSSNRIPDVAEIIDVEAWEARRCIQVTYPPSDLSVQVGSSAPNSPVQASSRTLSESEQIAVDFLASLSHSRDIPQGPSGSRARSNAKSKDGNPFSGPQIEPWFYIDIETARQNEYDDQFGAALFCAFVNDCHKRDGIRKEKQRNDEAPLSPPFPSIENNSSIECESCDEDAANEEYIYNIRACSQIYDGKELKTIKAHPGNAIWAMVESRHGSANDPRRWETACNRCSTYNHEQREQTIPLEEAAVDDTKNRTEGAAPYNPDLYTTTSSMRELRVRPHELRAELEDMAMSSNLSSPPPSFQAPSSGSNHKGKQKANGDGGSNERQPTPRVASARATSSGSRNRAMREANGNINSNASGTQAHPPPSPPPPTRLSLRNRRLFALEPQVPPLPPAPIASSSRYSQRHAPSPLGQTLDLINATTPEQVHTFSNNKTQEANNEDDEQGRRDVKKKKKNMSWDWKEGCEKANNKRKASEAVEDVDGGCAPRVARARRKIVSKSSNGSNELGASQKSRKSAASGMLAAGSGAASSGTGSNLTIPDVVAPHAPDHVTNSTSHATAPRSEGSSERRGRLRLHLAAEANPEHPDHEAYLMRSQAWRKRGRE